MFGKNILLPYLLNRRIREIDYMIFSHYDTDHCQGLIYVMENIKVKNVIISKQPFNSNNFEKFIKIAKQKNINIIIANKGDKINIEKNIFFDILWPDSNKFILENALNNNSLVCKLYYNDFSVLFTGDIEAIAEKEILNVYKNNKKILHSEILKAAHHGSKTSSVEEFVKTVKPKITLIGVGKDNKFGHPSNAVIERLQSIKCEIYRTDKSGEIHIRVDKSGEFKVKQFIQS